jgi:hypothetical protein
MVRCFVSSKGVVLLDSAGLIKAVIGADTGD